MTIGKKNRIEWWKLGVEAATLVAIVIYTIIAYRQWTAMRIATEAATKSADVAQKTLVATQRPWVSVRLSLGGEVKFDQRGVSTPIVLRMKNVGNSPAIGIWIDAEPVLSFGMEGEVINKQRSILANLRKTHQPGAPGYGHMLFPGEDFVDNISFQISREKIKEYQTRMAKSYGHDFGKPPPSDLNSVFPILPDIVGCVFYEFSFDESVHKTGFIAELYRTDPLHPNVRRGIGLDAGGTPANSLTLTPLIVGSYAD